MSGGKRCYNVIRDLQLEKRVRDLQHEDMGVTVIVHDEDTFDGPPHSEIFIVVLQALEASGNRGVFLRLRFLGAGAGSGRLRSRDEGQSVT
jgi:hypothetical protein